MSRALAAFRAMQKYPVKLNASSTATVPSSVRPPASRKSRDFAAAVTYRPKDIYNLFGISASTLHDLCTHDDPAVRLPSYSIAGRKGHKGKRFIRIDEFTAWFAKWRVVPSMTATEGRAA